MDEGKELLNELRQLKEEVASLKERGGQSKAWSKIFSKTNILIGILLSLLVSTIILYPAKVTKPFTFIDGTVISASDVNGNFDILYTESNSQDGRITALEGREHFTHTNIRFNIALRGQYPSRDGGDWDTQAVGEIRMFAGTYAPEGWAFCDGQVLPIVQNQTIYSIIGNIYGGNGTTNFNLPNLKGKVAVHSTP